MNYDPVKWCTTCQEMKPRETFRVVPGVSPKREVCENCYPKVMAGRAKAKRECACK